MNDLPDGAAVESLIAALHLEVKAVCSTRNGRRAKAVLFLGPPARPFSGVLKLPLFPAAGHALRDEIEALSHLSRSPRIAPYLPRIIWRSTSREVPLFVLSFERGVSLAAEARRGRRATRSCIGLVREFLAALGQCEPRGTGGPDRSDAVLDEIRTAVPDCAGPFERASRWSADVELARGYQHGDFVPKNLIVDRSGGLKVLDWEYATPGGRPVFDAMDMALRLISGDPRMATFQILDAMWREEGGRERLAAMLRRLWPPAEDDLRRAGIRLLAALYVQWCAWRFARAEWPKPARQCADVADRLLGGRL